MIAEDQTDVVEFLAAAPTHGTATVERIDTHSAIVFLAGEHAYKLKRAVRFDYLDFSTGKSTTVARDLGAVAFGLSASRDGRTVYFSRIDSSVDELMLVDNFR